MTILTRIAAVSATAAILALPTLTAASAGAAPAAPAKKWGVIAKAWGAKQQACKVSVKDGEAWKVFTRVVNGRTAEVGVGLMVNLDGESTDIRFATPLTGKGKTSKAGSVVLPVADGYTLAAFQFQGAMGDGGEIAIGKIRAC